MKPAINPPKTKAEYDSLVKTQEERIARAVTNVVLFHPFFAALLMNLRRRPDPTAGTMETDGVEVAWNPMFVASLEDDELRGVLIHEAMHCGMGHIWRYDPSWDIVMANMAMDYAVNNFIDTYNQSVSNSGVPPICIPGTPIQELRKRKPKIGEYGNFIDHKFDDHSFESIYSQLLADKDHQQMAEEMRKQMQQGQRGGQQQPGEGDDQQDGDGDPQDGDGQGQGTGSSVGGVRPPGTDPVTKEEVTSADWAQNMTQAAQAAKMMGKLPAELDRMVNGSLRPEVTWESVLHRFFDSVRQDDFNWQVPDRRFLGSGFYLPGMHSEGMGPIALLVDTSGSVDQETLNRIAAEIKEISIKLRPDKIEVVYCDAAVQATETFKPGDDIILRPKGGGGTDFRPAFDYVSKNLSDCVCAVYASDGWGTFPDTEPPYPVIWANYGRPAEEYPFGEVINVRI